jgi:hypothetical protein
VPLGIENGAAVCRGPWWIDYNHAPPGAGYLHLFCALHTDAKYAEDPHYAEVAGVNRFVEGNFSADWTNAKLTLRLKGELEARGSQLLFLAQAQVGTHTVGHLLTGQPFEITPEWSEQTVTLTPDPAQWKCLGVRHDRTETYAWGDVADVLRNLNVDVLLVLHPLNIVPLQPFEGDPHLLKAGEDYEVDRSLLPDGVVYIDEIRIEFA